MQTRDTQIRIHTSIHIRMYVYVCIYTYYTDKDIHICSGITASEVPYSGKFSRMAPKMKIHG